MILPQLQEALVVASDGLVARQRRRSQRFRLGLMTSAAVVTLGGGAVASQNLWAPLLGLDDAHRPSVSTTAPPRAQRDALAVLRRDQTAGDRGAAAQQALRLLGHRYSGVRLAEVRVLHPDATDDALALISVQRRSSSAKDAGPASTDALCAVVVVGGRDEAVPACFSLDEVRNGRATVAAGDALWGLVPDGVHAVRFAAVGRPAVTVRVRDNAYGLPLGAIGSGPTVSWRDARGAAVRFGDGAMAHRTTLRGPAPTLPANLHDCGLSRGGVVPARLACGSAAAKRFVPPAGQPWPSSRKP